MDTNSLATPPSPAPDPRKPGRFEELEKELTEAPRATVRKAEEFWHALGPGLTTGAADDDPSGIATYSQAGARYGFQLLWLAPFSFPLMAIVQEMCARIGMVTGRGLTGTIKRHFPRPILYLATLLLFAANTFNIGADLGAMAKATQLLNPRLNFVLLLVVFTAFSLALQIFTSYQKYARYLKWLALLLVAYIFSALLVDLDWRAILQSSLVPSLTFSREQILLITAVLGTTISPYLFFWQTSQEVEEEILAGKTNLKLRLGSSDQEIKKMRTDVWSGMFFSNLVMFFIIAAGAAVLHEQGVRNIATAADAALALRPLAGPGAYLLFTLGILGTGLLAVPVLAGSASYALSESFGWREGLYRKFKSAHAFYAVIIVAMLLGLALEFLGLDPVKALIYSAVGNGLVAPVILVLIVLLSANKKIMGDRANRPLTTFFGWLVVALTSVAGVATIVSLLG